MFKLDRLLVLAALPILLAGCGGGVSEEEFEAVQRDLQSARSQVQSLEAQTQELQAQVTTDLLEELGTLLSISELMVFEPTVVDLSAGSASFQMITKLPTTCSIAHGLTSDYGQISTDENMMQGGHTDHLHVLRGLQPDTVYHYKWGLLGPDGSQYSSKDFTLKTPPADAGG